MHAVRAAQSVGKPVFVVDYKEDLGDVISGNLSLKRSGGATGLRATAEHIRADKEEYLSLFAGKGEESALTLF